MEQESPAGGSIPACGQSQKENLQKESPSQGHLWLLWETAESLGFFREDCPVRAEARNGLPEKAGSYVSSSGKDSVLLRS